jgi:hypothetical protein
MAVVVGLLVGVALPGAAAGGRFVDDDDSVHEADIEFIAGLAVPITAGCNPPVNDRFCPEDNVTRGQMAAFLVRYFQYPDPGGNPFVDDDDSEFETDIRRLAGAGVTKGCNTAGDRYCPEDDVTRGQMAAFLVRAFGYTDTGSKDFVDDNDSIFQADIEKLAAAGVTVGCNPPANDRFCPDDPVTRGQMASFLARALRGEGVTTTSTTSTTDPGNTTTSGGPTTTTNGSGITTTTISSTGWDITTVDARTGAGRVSSVKPLLGLPAIAYRNDGLNILSYARCTNAACTSRVLTDLDPTPSTGNSVDLVVDGNLPFVAYEDLGNSRLKVADCADVLCDDATITAIADGGDDTGINPSATTVGGLPVISMYNRTDDTIDVVACGNDACTTSTVTPVVNNANLGEQTQILEVGGFPAILYQVASSLRLVTCSAADCSTTSSDNQVVPSGVASDFAMIKIGGEPVIAYRRAGQEDLRVAVCADAACSATTSNLTVVGADSGNYVSMVEGDDGFPWIAHQEANSTDLRFVDCGDLACTPVTLELNEVVDNQGETGRWTSIANVGGVPVITYLDDTEDELRLARQ